MLNLVLFGPPGAGKGTQSEKIGDKYNLVHISTGEVLRKAISEKTALGILAASYIDDGNFVPDDIAIGIIQEELKKYKNPNGFIFDGFPRTKYQAERFSNILSEFGGDINLMIALKVDENQLVQRIISRAERSGRPDDRAEDIIRKRIEIYNTKTAVVADYYKSLGKYTSIDGNDKIDVIFENICKSIEKNIKL